MNAGVDVVAVAAGQVIGVWNDMPDIDVNKVGGAIAVRDRECGNGVAILTTAACEPSIAI